MEFSILQIALVFLWVFIIAIDQFDLLESLYQPIVSGAVIGAILGDLPTGLVVGGTYQLMTIGNMPVGGAQPPNAVIGGVMAVVFAIGSKMDIDAAMGLAVPFAVVGQYMVTLLFTAMSPMMSVADKMAEKGDHKGIVRLNYLAMGALGLLFATVCTLGLIGGDAMGKALQSAFDAVPWLMTGLSAAGGMMRFVGFATLLRIMLSNDLWGIYFAGFSLATIIGYVADLTNVALGAVGNTTGIADFINTNLQLSEAGIANAAQAVADGTIAKVEEFACGLGYTGSIANVSGSALILIAFIGIALALNDFQSNVAMKKAGANGNGGDDDGI